VEIVGAGSYPTEAENAPEIAVERVPGKPIVVGIPWRPTPDREAAFRRVSEFYASLGFDVQPLDGGGAPELFNIGRSRNLLVEANADHAVMVLSDADTIPQVEPLVAAVRAVLDGVHDDSIHLPYHLYRRPDIARFSRTEPVMVDGACSGVMVFKPAAWLALGGEDERFAGWGYEDTALRLAHETLVGPMIRYRGEVTAFQHASNNRKGLAPNRALFQRYRDAHGDPERMQRLVEEARQYHADARAGAARTRRHEALIARRPGRPNRPLGANR